MKYKYNIIMLCKVEANSGSQAVEVARMMIEDENEDSISCIRVEPVDVGIN